MEFAFAIRLQRYSKARIENEFMEEKKMQPLVFVQCIWLIYLYQHLNYLFKCSLFPQFLWMCERTYKLL